MDPHQITNSTDLISSKNNKSSWELQTLQILQILLRHEQDHGRLSSVHISKHSCVCWCVRFVFLVLWCGVLCHYVWCWCWCWCAMCDVWCLWCVCCVWRGLARGKPPVCRFQTAPCVGSKRFCVYWQNARMLNTCARFAGTHGSVLNRHT